MKIGLFGGTFDPIHWGHLRSAEEVGETFRLDRVYFIPASLPPHKRGQTTTPARDRLQMVRLAVARNPRFSVSTVELARPGVSYSIDTIREFAAKLRKADSLYFIIGLDAFREIGTWKDFAEIFSLCNFIVTSRPGSKENDPLKGTGVAVKKLFCYDFKQQKLSPSERHTGTFYRAHGHRHLGFGNSRLGPAREIDPLSSAIVGRKVS